MENSPATSCRSSEIFMVLLLGKLIPALSEGPKEQPLHTERRQFIVVLAAPPS